MIQEEELTVDELLHQLTDLATNREKFVGAMRSSKIGDGTHNVLEIIEEAAR